MPDEPGVPEDPKIPIAPPAPAAGSTDSFIIKKTGGGGTRGSATWEPPSVEQLQAALPQYEVQQFVARGGMAAVYKGVQKSLERTVAIKVLPAGVEDEGLQYAERFKQEARAMAKFKHPGIVTVHEAGGTPEGLLYFVMEFIEGTDVARLLDKEGKLPPARAVAITSRICEALAYAHERGVVHRDIKPSNIMIDSDGTVKVADFGLAKTSAQQGGGFTLTNLAVGTPDYVAPEALIAGMKVDCRADLYAVGVMLYEMLTGKIPRGRFENPSGIVPRIDPRLDAIVNQAMQADREKRYASAQDMQRDLNAVADSLKSVEPDEVREAAPGTGAPMFRWLLGFLLVGVLALGGWVLSSSFKGTKSAPSPPSAARNSEEPDYPVGKWVKPFPIPEKIPGIAKTDAGWVLCDPQNPTVVAPLRNGGTLSLKDAGVCVRIRGRVPDAPHAPYRVWLQARMKPSQTMPSARYIPAAGTRRQGEFRLEITHGKDGSLTTLASAPLKTPIKEDEDFTMELYAVGKTLIGRLNRQTLTARYEDPEALAEGTLALSGADRSFFRDLEVINLDGLPETEALKLIGLGADGQQPSDATSGYTATAPGTTRWRDAFAESPLKEVIAKAEHTKDGYRLPDYNHWQVSPGSWRSGAVRVRATSANEQFISLYVALDDHKAERVRFRTAKNECVLSYGALVANEADFAAMSAPSPSDGKPHEILFARVAGRLRVELDGQRLHDRPDPSTLPGTFMMDVFRGAEISVQEVEHLDLDGVPESEALKLVAMRGASKDASHVKSFPPVQTGRTKAKAEAWVDVLRPDAAGMLQLENVGKPGPDGMVVTTNGKAIVAGTGGPGRGDGALRVRARFETVTQSRLSVRARYNNGMSYALMVLSPSKVAFQLWNGDGTTKTLKDFAPVDPLTPGQDYELELRAVGPTFTARLNGAALGEVEDTTLKDGAFLVGLGTGRPVTVKALEYLDLNGTGDATSMVQRFAPAADPTAATRENPFVNTLGMRFVPVPVTGGPTGGKRVLFSIWETRVRDYEVFAKETRREWPKPEFEQGPTHPAVNVNWNDAQAFCAWLTERERHAESLAASLSYRLPMDHEWSCAIGIGEREDPTKSPEEKSDELLDVFPWGAPWPPPRDIGNYSGEEAAGHETWKEQSIMTGYRDPFPHTAPAGSFIANQLGLFDLSGNAWEWCEDCFNAAKTTRVMRGASFNNGSRGSLYSAKRDHHAPESRSSNFGFRVVLAED